MGFSFLGLRESTMAVTPVPRPDRRSVTEGLALPWLEIAIVGTLVMSFVAFLAFGLDKWKAKRGSWRVPEATLLLLAFALGAPGAWFGSRTFRHKTVKTSFRIKLGLVSIFNPVWLLLFLGVRDAM
jgi:uncharacterized membrane protein YsdA (DUF1294 family)